MEFLNSYAKNILEPLRIEIIKLEEKMIKRKIFVSKTDKDKLEKLNKIYMEKIEWYERQLKLEEKIRNVSDLKIK